MTFFSPKKIKGIKEWGRELTKFCQDSDLSFAACNFHVTAVHTMLKKDDKPLPSSFFKESYNQVQDEIYQIFDVEVTPKEYDFSKLSFSFSHRHLEAILILKEGFLIGTREEYLNELVDYIVAFLIQKKIIITSIDNIRKRMEQIISTHFNTPCTLMEDRIFTFLRAKAGIKKKGFTNLLEEKWCRENNKTPMPSAMYAVNQGDHIGFFLKDSIPTSGRNLQGEYIDMKNLHQNTPKNDDLKEVESGTFNYKTPPEAGEGINKYEEGNVVKYEASGNGVVEFVEGVLRLIDIGTFKQITRTNSILGGLDKGIEIDIDCPDASKDAVQNGAVIEAEVVNVKGTVGEKVLIRAKRLTINGQTHQSSMLYAEEATIKIHKGTLHTNEGDIEKLEGGKVYGKDLNIIEAQGARINGDCIVISNLHSNTKIRFCEKLHLKAINGNDNEISFDLFASLEQRERLSTIIYRDNILSRTVKARVAFCKALVDRSHQLKPIIDKLKPVIDRSKKEGKDLDADTKKTLGMYVNLLKQIKEHKDMIDKLKQITLENARVGKELDAKLKEAKITTESSWKDNIQILLLRRFPESTYRILTQDSEMFEVCVGENGQLEKIVQ